MAYGSSKAVCCPLVLIVPDAWTGAKTCCPKDKICVNPTTGARTCCRTGTCVDGVCKKPCDLTVNEICPGPAKECCPRQTNAGQAVCMADGTCCFPPKTWCGVGSYSLIPPPNVLVAAMCCDVCVGGNT
jgi:hypothetical protein